MSFLDPTHLWFLLVVGALAVLYVVLQRRKQQYAVRFSNLNLLGTVAPKRPGWRRHLTALAFLAAIAAVTVAWARPTEDHKVPREKATVVVAIDTSLSMEADDVAPTRLEAAKAAADQFVDLLPPKINVGLVSFDGAARLEVSPTVDRTPVHQAIDNLTLHEGTAIGEAIFTSLDAIQRVVNPPTDNGTNANGNGTSSSSSSGQNPNEQVPARIVLMSDGKTTVGRSNDDAAQAAKDKNVPVSTIAFGTDAGTITIPEEPAPVPVPVDKDALQFIAQYTGGSFFEAATAQQLQKVYADIGSSIGYEKKPQEVTSWFVGLGLVALAVTAAMSLTWFNRLL